MKLKMVFLVGFVCPVVVCTPSQAADITFRIFENSYFVHGTGVRDTNVFGYAYFVNNNGWFQGPITANGDIRANGNLYLDSSCTVNGRAFAARNDELGVMGAIQNIGKMQDQSTYWSNCGNSARPTSPAYNGGDYYGGGYDAPVTVTTQDLNNRLHPYEDELTMPYISDLTEYIKYAQDSGGKLSGGISYKLDSNGNITQMFLGTINAHYDGVGPSGNASLSDRGALVLEGTVANPIVIDGPVVIDSDVVIRGYVKGQGTIYSGRNIHIVGSIQYVNAPSWPHPDTNPDATAQVNLSKDLLGLAAKGNIVMGDYTLSSWLGDDNSNGLQYYLKSAPYVQQYICDASDKNIGYPRTRAYGWTSDESKFCGDYSQTDGGKKVAVSTTTEYVYENGRRVPKTTTTIADSQTRKYYESVCPEKLIQYLCADTQSSRGAYQPTITRIDAVLYNNHGIIGHIGNCTINGSLVCRNEAMIFEDALKINWDHRLCSGLLGVPFASDLTMTINVGAGEYLSYADTLPARVVKIVKIGAGECSFAMISFRGVMRIECGSVHFEDAILPADVPRLEIVGGKAEFAHDVVMTNTVKMSFASLFTEGALSCDGTLSFDDRASVEIEDFADEKSWRNHKAVTCIRASQLVGMPKLSQNYGAWHFMRVGDTLKFCYMHGTSFIVR